MPALVPALLLIAVSAMPEDGGPLDLSHATVIKGRDELALAEKTAVAMLVEEVEKRTGIRWVAQTERPHTEAVVVVTSKLDGVAAGLDVPEAVRRGARELKTEGFVLAAEVQADRPVVWIIGADPRGVLFGVGKLLRSMRMTEGSASIDRATRIVTAPAYPIRGHQLGYRNLANSWDAWDASQYEQYIRELAIFGANCVENIPFQDDSPGPHMRVPRNEMNVRISEICQRYGLDYWVWTPADFDLADEARRTRALRDHEELYRACPRLDAVFVPGGDPGHNDPEQVIPFLKELAQRLATHHPKAKVWLSLQGFKPDRAEYVYRYLDEEQPDWFGGIVCGPSSPPISETRRRLHRRYPIRHYPDITHNVRAQYPVPWWDPALAFTLGREAINPRPLHYSQVHNTLAPDTVGFLSYSDGVHDDVNKVVWNGLGWDPEARVRDILIEYARFFFAPEIAEAAADGILALERNWVGSLRDNGGVEATRVLWEQLEQRSPQIAGAWRGQMCLLRAVYDSYTRERLINESSLEEQANGALAEAPAIGSAAAMDRAVAILGRAQAHPVRAELRQRIEALCECLFRSIGLQTSVERYQASNAQRGAILDFVDHPLNNRWWLEDEFAAIRKLSSEPERLARLELIRTWEHPGPGSFYDRVGDIAQSPHVVRGDISTSALLARQTPIPGVLWWESGKSRKRPAWMVVMNWPVAMLYRDLDPSAEYMIRTTGFGSCLMSIDGERVEPTLDNRDIGEFKLFPVPQRLLADGTLRLTFERPVEDVNWRYQSRLSELWLLKK